MSKTLIAQSVRLSGDFVQKAKAYAEAEHSSIPKQIEYWAKIGKMAIDNQDLSYDFIHELLIADSQDSVKEFKLTR